MDGWEAPANGTGAKLSPQERRIGNDYFDTKAAEMRAAQTALMHDMLAHQTANRRYIGNPLTCWQLRSRRITAAAGEGIAKTAESAIWLPIVDAIRTLAA